MCGNCAASAANHDHESGLSYHQYLEQYRDCDSPDVEYVIEGGSYVRGEGVSVVTEYAGRTGNFVATEETGYVEWEIEIDRAGLYSIEVDYYPLPGKTIPAERELLINGKRPFNEAELLVFQRVFADAGPVLVDKNGNQIRPQQVESPRWQVSMLRDSTGYVSEPFRFYFKEGKNTIRLVSQAEPLLIAQLRLCQPEPVRTYAEILSEYRERGCKEPPASGKSSREAAIAKLDPTLFVCLIRASTVEPYHPFRSRELDRWPQVVCKQWIEWEFTVPNPAFTRSESRQSRIHCAVFTPVAGSTSRQTCRLRN